MKKTLIVGALLYTAVMAFAGWEAWRYIHAGSVAEIFGAFAFLAAPLWFLGFGAAEAAAALPNAARIACAALPALGYLVAWPEFSRAAIVLALTLPVACAAILASDGASARMTWRDLAVLAIIVTVFYSKLLQPKFHPVLNFFPKLYLANVALYSFLVVRKLPGIGYCFVPRKSVLTVGLREWLFYLPFALTIGLGTGFIHFHPERITLPKSAFAIAVAFFFIAIPEELSFRGILQNLLETRLGRTPALLSAAMLFGLSHFNHGSGFNWRYVLLATIAGVFYGRAWRANRQILASVVTHTAVDVVWSLWFR